MRRTALALSLFALALHAAVLPAAAQRRAPRSLLLVHVVDEQGQPLHNAYVTVAGMDHGESTDRAGDARINGIPRGNRLVTVRRQGFEYRRRGTDFVGGDTVRTQVEMTPAPIELEGITVTTWGRSMRLVRNGFYARQRRGLGAFMTRERLDQIRPYRITDAFRYMRGFMVRPNGGDDIVTSSRGSSLHACTPSVYIDGMQMFTRDARDQSDALRMVPPEDVEGIEAYQGPGSVPAEYNMMGTTCGVILIWTRQG